MVAFEVNPYSAPAAAMAPRTDGAGRLVATFRVEDAPELLRSIRTYYPGETAELIAIAAFILVLAMSLGTAYWSLQIGFVAVGYVGGAVAGFVARGLAVRRLSYLLLANMREATGLEPGCAARLEVTQTKLVLTAGKRSVWPLRKTSFRSSPRQASHPPFIALTAIAGRGTIVPISAFADFGELSPQDFARLCERRADACRRRAESLWWRRVLIPWKRFRSR